MLYKCSYASYKFKFSFKSILLSFVYIPVTLLRLYTYILILNSINFFNHYYLNNEFN